MIHKLKAHVVSTITWNPLEGYHSYVIKQLKQQQFLRLAMEELGTLLHLGRPMTRDELSSRLCCSRKTFDKWMLDTANGCEMPEYHWAHVREILAHEKLKARVKKVLKDIP